MSIYDHPLYKELGKFFRESDVIHTCAFGLPIYMQRNASKAWCGYVGVPHSHSHYGKSYSDRVPAERNSLLITNQSPIALLCEALQEDDGLVALDILYEAPGGLTWAENYYPSSKPDGRWWFGFDCNHYNDLSPRDIIVEMVEGTSWRQGVYRTQDFALTACRKLAEQLMENA